MASAMSGGARRSARGMRRVGLHAGGALWSLLGLLRPSSSRPTSGRPSALVRSSPLPVRVQLRADGRLPATAKQPRITLAVGAFHQRETRGWLCGGHPHRTGRPVRTVRVRDDSVGGVDAIAARIWSACRT